MVSEKSGQGTDHIGTYTADDGRVVWIQPSGEQLEYVDFATGTFEDLHSATADSFIAGSGLEVVFARGASGRIEGLVWRPRGSAGHFATKVSLYHEEPVTFESGDATLVGTLVLPTRAGPHPAIVMVHGSGPATRRHGSNVPFLASHGIAVLTYDKRGVGESTSPRKWWQSSFEELAHDILAGLRFLQNRRDIRSDQIGLYGSSQGGWIVALAATLSPDVAFIIMGSGPAVDLPRQETYRVERQMRAAGFSEADLAQARRLMSLKFSCVRSGQGWDELAHLAQEAKPAAWFQYVGGVPTADDAPWWRPLVNHDPLSVLEQVGCPLLAFFGGGDIVVPVDESIVEMKRALERGGNRDHTIMVLQDANHSLLLPADASPDRIARYAAGYRETLIDWLHDHEYLPRDRR